MGERRPASDFLGGKYFVVMLPTASSLARTTCRQSFKVTTHGVNWPVAPMSCVKRASRDAASVVNWRLPNVRAAGRRCQQAVPVQDEGRMASRGSGLRRMAEDVASALKSPLRSGTARRSNGPPFGCAVAEQVAGCSEVAHGISLPGQEKIDRPSDNSVDSFFY